MGRLLLLGTLLTLAGCSGNSAGDGGSGGPGNGPVCAADQFIVTGMLDGEAVEHSGALSGHAWIQSSTGSFLDIPFEGGGSFHAEWDGLVADNQTFAASGTIILPVGGPHGGGTLDYTSGSLTKHDQGVSFELAGLSSSVQCVTTPCPGSAVQGTLQGCVEWAPIGAP